MVGTVRMPARWGKFLSITFPQVSVSPGPAVNGLSNATVDLVRKCRYLTIEMSSAADDAIFSGLLSNDHECIDVTFVKSEDNRSVLILPKEDIANFLMRFVAYSIVSF
ncbi:hypothetical protein DdX_19520 [Ditylenchus destructor]|uniref:Uncharacterized protein n=1 Tax=Ditylenchus destructor TaxID=166010 RepID=A0AAD4MN14_9BILA|nr:hypothetical protein DdX_19520 [Ditylenchus destructor]